MDDFDVVSKYNGKSILDTNLETHSKVALFFRWIVSCVFGMPDCDMGHVAQKIDNMVTQDPQLLAGKAPDQLERFAKVIYDLTKKFNKSGREDKASVLETLDHAASIVRKAISDLRLETSRKKIAEQPDLLKFMNDRPNIEQTINPTDKFFREDFNIVGRDIYFKRVYSATYKFGESSQPFVINADEQETLATNHKTLTERIKAVFNRSDKPVLDDNLLRAVFNFLGPNGCAAFDDADRLALGEKGFGVGGPRDPLVETPPVYHFQSSANPNEATLVTTSAISLFRFDAPEIPIFFEVTNTFSISPKSEGSQEYNVTLKREFKPL